MKPWHHLAYDGDIVGQSRWRVLGQFSHVRKQSYSPDADTRSPAAHFEPNDITIICESLA
jgi:hypothetical protein